MQELQYCGDLMRSALMADPISTIFGVCVWILQVIGDFTGMGYELANVAILVVIHPALTLALFVLWRRAQRQALECSCTEARDSSSATHPTPPPIQTATSP